MSVWESVEALERFVWATVHKQFYNRKGDWFEKLATPHFVMWPIAAGHIPDLDEAKARLEHLTPHGDSDFAFGWSHLAAHQAVDEPEMRMSGRSAHEDRGREAPARRPARRPFGVAVRRRQSVGVGLS